METRATFYKVKSFTENGIVYDVVHRPDDTWICSCPAFVFSDKNAGFCKHIKYIHAQLEKGKNENRK